MKEREGPGENSLEILKERAKELDCLYQVDEVLNNSRLPLPEVFERIILVLPSGFRFPDICRVEITYKNHRYRSPDFVRSRIADGTDIKTDGKTVGRIEVIYTGEVPVTEEGYFLEKERKLIKTIADRIGRTVFYRRAEQMVREWSTPRKESEGKRAAGADWMAIVELLQRTDQDILLHICRKMINHLCSRGIREAEQELCKLNFGSKVFFPAGEVNTPSQRLPLGDLAKISEKAFFIASKNMSDGEISTRLMKWIQETKAYSLIKTIDRIDVSIGDVVEALSRYTNTAGAVNMLDLSTERWLRVALIRRFLSDKPGFIRIAQQYLEIGDFHDITQRLIYPAGSHGKIGGKSTGLFLAREILKRERDEVSLLDAVKTPKTWYIATDEMREFLHYNNLQGLNEQRYRDLYEIRIDYPNIIQMMKNSEFPAGIVKSLAMALDDFGDSPLIVRSSSLLEDQSGAAFSGKYKSLFLANQGTKKDRLEDLKNAIIEVYASVYSPDSIQYRAERGLLDYPEEMGIMIQEVVGRRIGPYYLPLYGGVAFSNNEFRWSPRIKRSDGLIRLVPGMGTRAVDRLSDDFPVLISPGRPGLRVNAAPEEIKRYSPAKIDVINLEKNTFETIYISSFLKKYGHLIPDVQHMVSVWRDDYVKTPPAFDIDFEHDDLIVTFDGLIKDSPFIRKVHKMIEVLEERLETPVDIEFASDGENFYLLQCRPQSFREDSAPAAIPKDIDEKNVLFSAKRYVSNGTIHNISHIVYVDPEAYDGLQERDDLVDVGKAVGRLNAMLPKRCFILMGPGRWGSRGDIKLGVQVSYSDISNTVALIEIARTKSNYVPELSFGTHFFQDLVEANIRYLPLYPDDKGILFNERFLRRAASAFTELLPDFRRLEDVVRVIDVADATNGNVLRVVMNAELEEALGYFAPHSRRSTLPLDSTIQGRTTAQRDSEARFDDRFWRWRSYMAERIAARLDPSRFGVKGVYLFGSTNSGTAGPGSDIDLLIHFDGTDEQRKDLLQWLEGWSASLAEINYLKTGYSSEGLLDVHIITDEDIAKKTSYAVKIGAVTDPAHSLKLTKK
ncbi:MAG: pyruvate, phosphate dikinase [Syntrophorhabdus aromaticivorans]|uniref:Phosphoenolpyruvate synthase n=1 Tax=Syntrophorhabdus aromaticivorans TaxID=328301 RepID=A0A971M4V9_9BACT|nr:pyruvate, phosphate dikinase [Syntrophorhabdus aromaticivorans]